MQSRPDRILNGICTIVFEVLYTRLGLTGNGSENGPALDLASVTTFSFLYFFFIAFLCYFYLNVSYWTSPEESPRTYLASAPPVEQFPGQWGTMGQQPQYLYQINGQFGQYSAYPPQTGNLSSGSPFAPSEGKYMEDGKAAEFSR